MYFLYKYDIFLVYLLFIIEHKIIILQYKIMKRTLNQRQLENMIAECVGQVIAESRQPRRKNNRMVMNEAQLNSYIQGIINEEMENELFGGLGRLASKGAAAVGKMGQQAWQGAKNAGQQAWQGAKNAGQQFGQNVKDTYRNGEAMSALKTMQTTMQKYGSMFPNKGAVAMINKGIEGLMQGIDNGTVQA